MVSGDKDQLAEWTFSEAQRVANLIQQRTQRATFNVVSAIAVAVVPAATLTATVDPLWYLIGPVFLSLMPLMMLEEDKETVALGRRLSQLEEMVNKAFLDRQLPELLISEKMADRSTILGTRLGLYSIFVLIWVGSWAIAFVVLFRSDVWIGAKGSYVALCAAILLLGAISAMKRNELAQRLP